MYNGPDVEFSMNPMQPLREAIAEAQNRAGSNEKQASDSN